MIAQLTSRKIREEQRLPAEEKLGELQKEHAAKSQACQNFLLESTEDKSSDAYQENRTKLFAEMQAAGTAVAEQKSALEDIDANIALAEQAEQAVAVYAGDPDGNGTGQRFNTGANNDGQGGPSQTPQAETFLWRQDNSGDTSIDRLKGVPIQWNEEIECDYGQKGGGTGRIHTQEIARPEYQALFKEWIAGNCQTAEFLMRVRDTVQQGSPDNYNEGGWLQPTMTFINRLQRCNDKAVWMRRLSTVRTVPNASSLGIRKRTTGITSAAWGCRCAEPGKSFPKGEVKELRPRLYTVATSTCREVLRSSAIDTEAFLAQEMAIAEREHQEQGYLHGDGRNKPLGLFADSDLTVHPKAAGALTGDDLIDMFGKLPERAMQMNNNSWIMSKELWLAIMKLPATGTGGYLWDIRAGAGIEGRPWRGTLLGMPVYVSEFVTGAITANDKPAVLGDISTYEIADFPLGTGLEREDTIKNDEAAWYMRRYTDGLAVCGDSIVRLEIT